MKTNRPCFIEIQSLTFKVFSYRVDYDCHQIWRWSVFMAFSLSDSELRCNRSAIGRLGACVALPRQAGGIQPPRSLLMNRRWPCFAFLQRAVKVPISRLPCALSRGTGVADTVKRWVHLSLTFFVFIINHQRNF